jgi:hypothetical protein
VGRDRAKGEEGVEEGAGRRPAGSPEPDIRPVPVFSPQIRRLLF